jgi:Protein of unknown function (DUF1552)
MKIQTLSRRLLLQVAAAGATTAMLPSLLARKAQADTPTAPPRVLFVYSVNPVTREFYTPIGSGGNPKPTENVWDFQATHSALTPYRSKIIATRGLSMLSQELKQVAGANAHVKGGTHALTATARLSPSLANGISIDQLIARAINTPTIVTKYGSLEIDLLRSSDGEGGPTYVGPGQPATRITEPDAALANFGLLGSPTAEQKAAAAAELARAEAALDFVLKGYRNVKTRLSVEDKARLDAHAQAVADLRTRVGMTVSPTKSMYLPDQTLQNDVLNFKANRAQTSLGWDITVRLAVAALACDLTRVQVLHMPGYDNIEPFMGATGFKPFRAAGTDINSAHALDHLCYGAGTALWKDPTQYSGHTAKEWMALKDTATANFFAGLLKRLQDTPDGYGASMLDSTLVVWCGQIADGSHDTADLSWTLAGNINKRFRTGRFLQFDATKTSHNNLFVSVAQAMGVNINTFGDPGVCTGPLSGLT